jgi:hypothetical protein
MAESQPVSFPRTENQLATVHLVETDDKKRWVVFEYCISLVAVTFRRTSRPYHVKPKWAWLHGLPYVGISLLFGWWGLPWGVIYTPITVFANLSGGCDITAQVRELDCPDA